jgi:hypothetical protein
MPDSRSSADLQITKVHKILRSCQDCGFHKIDPRTSHRGANPTELRDLGSCQDCGFSDSRIVADCGFSDSRIVADCGFSDSRIVSDCVRVRGCLLRIHDSVSRQSQPKIPPSSADSCDSRIHAFSDSRRLTSLTDSADSGGLRHAFSDSRDSVGFTQFPEILRDSRIHDGMIDPRASHRSSSLKPACAGTPGNIGNTRRVPILARIGNTTAESAQSAVSTCSISRQSHAESAQSAVSTCSISRQSHAESAHASAVGCLSAATAGRSVCARFVADAGGSASSAVSVKALFN